MLRVEQKTYTNLADLAVVSICEPDNVAFDRLGNRLDHEATLHIEGVAIRLAAGEDLQFLRDLLAIAEEALAWAEDCMCRHCQEEVRLADGDLCPTCYAESQQPNEHAEADSQMRMREYRAERGAA